MNNKAVPWSSSEGQSLKESLVLSKEAKMFAIAREIASLSTTEPFGMGAYTAAIIGMMYAISSRVNYTQNFYARPRALRLMWYGLVAMFGWAMWIVGKDGSTIYYESEADKAVVKLGGKYARGGLEYYEKLLQRNVALRTIMGSEGEKLYTAYGNDQVGWGHLICFDRVSQMPQ